MRWSSAACLSTVSSVSSCSSCFLAIVNFLFSWSRWYGSLCSSSLLSSSSALPPSVRPAPSRRVARRLASAVGPPVDARGAAPCTELLAAAGVGHLPPAPQRVQSAEVARSSPTHSRKAARCDQAPTRANPVSRARATQPTSEAVPVYMPACLPRTPALRRAGGGPAAAAAAAAHGGDGSK